MTDETIRKNVLDAEQGIRRLQNEIRGETKLQTISMQKSEVLIEYSPFQEFDRFFTDVTNLLNTSVVFDTLDELQKRVDTVKVLKNWFKFNF